MVSHFFSYETRIESHEAPKTNDRYNSTSACCDNGHMSRTRLKGIVEKALAAMQKEHANNQLIILQKLNNRKSYGFDKFMYMIQLNTVGWKREKRNEFLQWYADELGKILRQSV